MVEEGEAEKTIDVFRCHSDHATGLAGALNALEMRFGYQKTDIQHELAEISDCPQVDTSVEGMRVLLKDISSCYVKVSFGQLEI